MGSARKIFGIVLLLATVGVASCQGLLAQRTPLTPLTSPQHTGSQPSDPQHPGPQQQRLAPR